MGTSYVNRANDEEIIEEEKVETDPSIFKIKVFNDKHVDELIEDAFVAVNRDDKKVGRLIDELMMIIEDAASDEDQRIAQISFLAPVLAELFKSSADFKKQKTDLLNSIQKYVATEYKKKEADNPAVGFGLEDILADIAKRK